LKDNALRAELTFDLQNYVLDFLSSMCDNLDVAEYILVVIQNRQAILNENNFSLLCISILLKELIVGEKFVLDSSDGME
jgi:hypothetical protein